MIKTVSCDWHCYAGVDGENGVGYTCTSWFLFFYFIFFLSGSGGGGGGRVCQAVGSGLDGWL